jgi:hypothetical protein
MIFLHDYCTRHLLTRLTIADDLDQLLLLTIHYVCSANSVKIPWAEVAKVMGNNTSEGAIIQHLDKKRKKRVELGMAVPPPRKRGSGGGASRASHTSVARGRKTQVPGVESGESSDEEWVENGASQRKKPRRKARTPYTELPKLEFEESDDSDSEMLVPNADFLELPNDRSQTEAQQSPSPKQSLVVALQCPKWFSEDNQSASTISPTTSSFEQTDTPTSLAFSFPETVDYDPYSDGSGAEAVNKIAPTDHGSFDLPSIEPFDTPYAQFPADTSSYFFPEDFQLNGDFSQLLESGMDMTGDSLASEYWLGGQMGQQYQ